MGNLSKADQQELYKNIISIIPPEITSSELGSFLSTKPTEERNKAVAQFRATVGGVPAIGPPRPR